ncbi:MAG: NAD(P)H-dependent oxidoreductase [Candidatus Omnitrophica bacterium]|nr:NAD(P)H-dependent oxidoreductase [Candidatus Omnitrophota bacterium]
MKKAIVVYYSYSGNTRKTAEFLKDKITRKFQTDMLELKPSDESKFFLKQCVRAFRKVQADLNQDLILDLKEYDLIALGTPVWAFGMAPAMRGYIDKVKGLAGKKIILFATYGSGVGKDKCLREMAEIVKAKGAEEVRSFLVQQYDVKNANIFEQKANGLV